MTKINLMINDMWRLLLLVLLALPAAIAFLFVAAQVTAFAWCRGRKLFHDFQQRKQDDGKNENT